MSYRTIHGMFLKLPSSLKLKKHFREEGSFKNIP
jgi:hypothetical protein